MNNMRYAIKRLPQIPKLYCTEYPIHSTIPIRQYVIQKRDIPYSIIANQSRMYSADYLPKEDSYFTKMVKKIWSKQLTESKMKLQAYLHYENVVDVLDYDKWFNECKLQDTFMSWFLVTELHIWMLMVRCMAEGELGRSLRNDIVEAFWNDVSLRCSKLGAISGSRKKRDLEMLSQQFQAALTGYDEGLLNNDMVLAGTVWRRFYQMTCQDATDVEKIVEYIRKQTAMLDKIPREKFLDNRVRSVFWTTIPNKK